MEFILKYKESSKSKLLMLKRIMQFVKEKHRENELTDEFKVEYIRLLNIFEKGRVFTELQTGKYPTSECLKLCEEHKNQLSIAYLKERLGYYPEALKIYKARFRKIIKALVKGKRYKDSEKSPLLISKLSREANMVLSMCKDAENHQKVDYIF